MNTVEKNVDLPKMATWALIILSSVLLVCLLLWPEFQLPRWSMPIFMPAILIFGYWRTKSEFNAWMLLLAGMMLDQALMSSAGYLLPFADAVVRWSYQWWPWSIVGFAVIVGAMTIVMLWVFDSNKS